MGQRTDQAERDVAEQRQRISRRLDELSGQLGGVAEDAGHELRGRASIARERVANSADRVPGKRALEDAVPAHPLTSIIGGFTAGVALGMLRVPGGDDGDRNGHGARDDRGRDGHGRRERDDSSGLVDRLTGLALGTMMGPLQQRLGELAEEAVAGFMGRRDAGQADGDERPRREEQAADAAG
ncbi:MAG: hypothetical protein AB7L91_08835 [Dehalococcoidia bacterium]